jgi:alcohol dehydrogenase (cytochrome c)
MGADIRIRWKPWEDRIPIPPGPAGCTRPTPTGEWKWRLKSNYPILSGITRTAGGLVFFGDMGGNLYAVDAVSGKPLWKKAMGGALGAGVITYVAGGSQKIAVAAGTSSIVWPAQQTTARIVIFGLPRTASASPQ